MEKRYKLGEVLGKGAFGTVHKALDVQTGEQFAIKQIPLVGAKDQVSASILSEIELLKQLNHRNIVKYVDLVQSPHSISIVMEMVEAGSLALIIRKFGLLPEPLVCLYVKQVLNGLVFLHDQGVIHRDIKGANILSTKTGEVKLADFGVATMLKETNQKSHSVVGSPYWLAPEVIDLAGATAASDIWSVGCTVIELLTGHPPYYDMDPMPAMFRIHHDEHPPLPEGLSANMKSFLLECFVKDPSKRISAKNLLRHPLLANVDPSSSLRGAVTRIQRYNDDGGDRSGDRTGDRARDRSMDRSDSSPSPAAASLDDAESSTEGRTVNQSENEKRLSLEILRLISLLEAGQTDQVIVNACNDLVTILRNNPVQRRHFVAHHGVVPIVDMLEGGVENDKVVRSILIVVNQIIAQDAKLQESLCMLGGIPAIMTFAGPAHPLDLRLQAAYFLHDMCHASQLTLQMCIACRSLPTLVSFLEPDYAVNGELVRLGIDAVLRVLALKTASDAAAARQDFCRLFAKAGLLRRLVVVLSHLIADEPDTAVAARYVKNATQIVLYCTQADAVTRTYMTEPEVLAGLLGSVSLVPTTEARTDLLATFENLSNDPAALQPLVESGAIPVLVPFMDPDAGMGQDAAGELRSMAFRTVSNVLKLNRSHQDIAATHGIVPHLVSTIQSPSADDELKALAIWRTPRAPRATCSGSTTGPTCTWVSCARSTARCTRWTPSRAGLPTIRDAWRASLSSPTPSSSSSPSFPSRPTRSSSSCSSRTKRSSSPRQSSTARSPARPRASSRPFSSACPIRRPSPASRSSRSSAACTRSARRQRP